MQQFDLPEDIVIIDNIIPEPTQKRFNQYVATPDFSWDDYNHINSAGMYRLAYKINPLDVTVVPTDSLIRLCYFNDGRQEKMLNETIYQLGQSILDEYCKHTGKKIIDIIRMKINNQRQSALEYNANCCNEIHIDNESIKNRTLVYYINDSDGDTFLFDKFWEPDIDIFDVKTIARVKPKRGTIVAFDTDRFHAPSNPIFYQRRYILNINFLEGIA
jgi:hypothetical protein